MAARQDTASNCPTKEEVLGVLGPIVSSMESESITIDLVAKALAKHFNVHVDAIRTRYRGFLARLLPQVVARRYDPDSEEDETSSTVSDAKSEDEADSDSTDSMEDVKPRAARTVATQNDPEEEIEELGDWSEDQIDDKAEEEVIEVAPGAQRGQMEGRKAAKASSPTRGTGKSKKAVQAKSVNTKPANRTEATRGISAKPLRRIQHQRGTDTSQRTGIVPGSKKTKKTPTEKKRPRPSIASGLIPPTAALKRPRLKTSAGRAAENPCSMQHSRELEAPRNGMEDRFQSPKPGQRQKSRQKQSKSKEPRGLANLKDYAKAVGLFGPNSKLQRGVKAASAVSDKCNLLRRTIRNNGYTFEREFPTRKEIERAKVAAEMQMERDGLDDTNILGDTARPRRATLRQPVHNDGDSSGSEAGGRFGYPAADEEEKKDSSDASVVLSD